MCDIFNHMLYEGTRYKIYNRHKKIMSLPVDLWKIENLILLLNFCLQVLNFHTNFLHTPPHH
jgi:hypothetical protein